MKLTAADVLKRKDPGNFGDRPIHVAAVRGSAEEFEALIAGGADVNASGELGNNALHEAVGQGHKNAVEILLNAGANKDAVNNDGGTPREIAKILGLYEIAALLE